MNVFDLIDPSFSCRLVSTLMHFLWQGCLVALLAILGDWLLSRASASRRYALHVAALAIMVACVVVTFSRIPSPVPAPAESESVAVTTDAAPVGPGRENVEPSSRQPAATPAFSAVEPSFPKLPPAVGAIEAVQPSIVRPGQPASDADHWRPLRRWAPRITLLYFVCCGLLLARLMRGTSVAHQLRQKATMVSDDSLLATLRRAAKELGLRVLPHIAWSAEVSIPLVVGVLKPMILLPAAAATGLSPDQLQALITHELAHIRRYDLLVNLLQRLVEAMLFFHPAVWFISRRISSEREQACDELVLATGCERLRYADALVRMAELSSSLRNLGTSAPATSLAAAGANCSEFKRRVLKVLSVPTAPHLRPTRTALLVIVVLIVGVAVSASRLRLPAFAGTLPENDPARQESGENENILAKDARIDHLKPGETPLTTTTTPPAGLEFLKPYPKLHGLSLNMTESRFLEIVKQQELKATKVGEGDKAQHHIGLGDGHTLIVMFDQAGNCQGIQRVRGEETDRQLKTIDSAPMAECRALIKQLDEAGDVRLASEARERLAKRWKWVTEQPVASFLRELPKKDQNVEPRDDGELVGVQTELDGVWSNGKGTGDNWKDWIVRRQNGYRIGRLHLLFEAAQGYRKVQDAASAKRVLQAGLSGYEIHDADLQTLIGKYWPVTDDEPEKSLGPGPEAWTLANYLGELSAAQQALGEVDQAIITHSRLTLAHFMLSWSQPSGGPTKHARELWSLIRPRPESVPPLFWFNLVDEKNSKHKFDLSSAGQKGQPLTYHHYNLAAAPSLDFGELTVTAQTRGRKGLLDCYRINAAGTHETIGLLQPSADGEADQTLTKTFQVPAGTGLVQFMVAGEDFRVGEVTVEAKFVRQAAEHPGPHRESSVRPALRYSESTEVVLSMNSLKFLLDLDSGQTMDPPATIRAEQKMMDIHPIQQQPYDVPPGLTGLSLRGVKAKPQDWNVAVDALQKVLASDRVVALTKLPFDANETATYFFRTADGTDGILQLLAQTDEPKGIRLRYKTLVATKTNAASMSPFAPIRSETNVDPLGGPVPSTESGYPIIRQTAGAELPGGWIPCEFGVQYRVHAETTSLVLGELPLLFVDVRNRGTFKDMGLELHQSQHALVVDGNKYERRDQPWAGVTPLEPGGQPLTLAFVLSDDWKREGEPNTPLRLALGKHRITLSLMIAPVYPSPEESRTTPGSRKPIIRSLVCEPIEMEVRSGPWSGPPGSLGLENIRREVIAVPEFHSPVVPANLRRLVQEHQPAAGDYLVKLIKSDDPSLQQASAVVFANAWDSMNREQIEGYLLATLTHFVWQRSLYPRGVDAMIGMGPRHRPGHLGLPADRKYSAETVTTLHLDGRHVDQPIAYPGFGSLTHWVRTKDLSLGRHTLRLATRFTFTRGTETYRGEYESPEFTFEMGSADTPDDLIASQDEQLDRLVREALHFAETDYELDHPPDSEHIHPLQPDVPDREKWRPQISWGENKLGLSDLHAPVWMLKKRLPVDLCFSVDFHVENSETRIRCNDLISLAVDGERRGYFSPHDFHPRAEMTKHADKDGFVTGRLVLTASRSAALTDPNVKRYYGGTITTQPLRFKVGVTHAMTSTRSEATRSQAGPGSEKADEKNGEAGEFHGRLRTLLLDDASRQTSEMQKALVRAYARDPTELRKELRNQWEKLGLAMPAAPDPLLYGWLEVAAEPLAFSDETRVLVERDFEGVFAAALRLLVDKDRVAGRMAAELLWQHRQRLTDAHWRRIIEQRIFDVPMRPQYPAGIEAHFTPGHYAPLGKVLFNRAGINAPVLRMETAVLVDGTPTSKHKELGFNERGSCGDVSVGKLPPGRHACMFIVDYVLTLKDEANAGSARQIQGQFSSPEYKFEVLPSNAPDTLAARMTDELAAQVEAAVVVSKTGQVTTYSKKLDEGGFIPILKFVCPALEIAESLPVALCMEPTIYFEGDRVGLSRTAIVHRSGQKQRYVLENWVGDDQLRKRLENVGDGGVLNAKVALVPSRALALSHADVDAYYPRSVVRDIEFHVVWTRARGRPIPNDEDAAAVMPRRPADKAHFHSKTAPAPPNEWIDAEYGLQYRLRVDETALAAGEFPLVTLEIRNAGNYKDLAIDTNPIRHRVFVNGIPFERTGFYNRQAVPLPPKGELLTLTFALSNDWGTRFAIPKKAVPLPLAFEPGRHRVGIQLEVTRNHRVAAVQGKTSLFGADIGREYFVATRPVEFTVDDVHEASGAKGSPNEVALRNLRRIVKGLASGESMTPVEMNFLKRTGLLKLVRDNQPESGNLLITLVGDGNDDLPDPASLLLASVWDSLSREQIEAYFKAAMTVEIKHQDVYPVGSGDPITSLTRFRPGYTGLPFDRQTKAEVTVSYRLDGQPYGKRQTFDSASPASVVFVRDIPAGQHRLQAIMNYRFTRAGESYEGTRESAEAAFEIARAKP